MGQMRKKRAFRADVPCHLNRFGDRQMGWMLRVQEGVDNQHPHTGQRVTRRRGERLRISDVRHVADPKSEHGRASVRDRDWQHGHAAHGERNAGLHGHQTPLGLGGAREWSHPVIDDVRKSLTENLKGGGVAVELER